MKNNKQTTKIALRKETLATLNDLALTVVAGGKPDPLKTFVGSQCNQC